VVAALPVAFASLLIPVELATYLQPESASELSIDNTTPRKCLLTHGLVRKAGQPMMMIEGRIRLALFAIVDDADVTFELAPHALRDRGTDALVELGGIDHFATKLDNA
jgi:hypothetical protein